MVGTVGIWSVRSGYGRYGRDMVASIFLPNSKSEGPSNNCKVNRCKMIFVHVVSFKNVCANHYNKIR